ncbi:hypothetical protein D3C86_1203720 [compost metagenome]
MQKPEKPSSSARQFKPKSPPPRLPTHLSPQQQRMVDGTMSILEAVELTPEAKEMAQEAIRKAARKR